MKHIIECLIGLASGSTAIIIKEITWIILKSIKTTKAEKNYKKVQKHNKKIEKAKEKIKMIETEK